MMLSRKSEPVFTPKKPKNNRPSRRTNVQLEGAAFAEAVIAIPVFVLLWVGVTWISDRYQAYQVNRQQVRVCAWQWSSQGCEGSPPPACRVVKTADDSAASVELDGRIEHAESMLRSRGGPLSSLFGVIGGQSLIATSEVTLESPGLIGGGHYQATSELTFPCNEIPRTAAGLAGNMADSLSQGFF